MIHTPLGLLTIVAVPLLAPIDEDYPIEIKPEHDSVAWTVELQDRETSCQAKAWIGRMGEQPLANLFAVELHEEVAPTASGATTGADVDPIRRSELAAQLKSCIRATGMMPLGYISNFSFGLIA